MELNIKKIRQGNNLTVIVINGFLSESSENVNDWLNIVDKTYKNATVMHLEWPASKMSKNVINMITSQIATNGIATLLSMTIPLIGPIAAASTTIKLMAITREWRKAMDNTVSAGQFLANHIDSNTGGYVIMGHSLGARIIYHSLKKINKKERVKDVYLLGGAVSHKADWNTFGHCFPHLRIFNLYSKKDSVLKYLYKAGTGFSNEPVGRNAIKSSSVTYIKNHDVSLIVDGHMKYKTKNIGEYIANFLIKERKIIENDAIKWLTQIIPFLEMCSKSINISGYGALDNDGIYKAIYTIEKLEMMEAEIKLFSENMKNEIHLHLDGALNSMNDYHQSYKTIGTMMSIAYLKSGLGERNSNDIAAAEEYKNHLIGELQLTLE